MPLAERALEAAHREGGARVVAALSVRFRDLDLAEEAYAEACARAVAAWSVSRPDDPGAWLYRTATRAALDQLRRRAVRQRHIETERPLIAEAEDEETDDMLDSSLIPDERLRLIFVCCHPALAEEARVALTLKTVCRLDTDEIARAFLVPEPTLAQRLVRAKRKIAEAGVPFEVPGPDRWAERLSAVLSTVEVAYSLAHADAAGSGTRAEFGPEMLSLARLLAELLPDEADVLALAATVHFAEARRPARVDVAGIMIPLAEQDPRCWNRDLIIRGDAYLQRGFMLQDQSLRLLKAGIHAAWCRRTSLADPPPWPKVLALYDALLGLREDPFVRLNRIVALAEVEGVVAGWQAFAALDAARFERQLAYRVVEADLLRRMGRWGEASQAYRRALELQPSAAEAGWLRKQLKSCA